MSTSAVCKVYVYFYFCIHINIATIHIVYIDIFAIFVFGSFYSIWIVSYRIVSSLTVTAEQNK